MFFVILIQSFVFYQLCNFLKVFSSIFILHKFFPFHFHVFEKNYIVGFVKLIWIQWIINCKLTLKSCRNLISLLHINKYQLCYKMCNYTWLSLQKICVNISNSKTNKFFFYMTKHYLFLAKCFSKQRFKICFVKKNCF